MDLSHKKTLKLKSNILLVLSREGGDRGFFNSLVPKVFNNVFLFVGFTILTTLLELSLVGSLRWVSKRFNH